MRIRRSSIGSALLPLGLSIVAAANAGQLPKLLNINPDVLQFNPTGLGSTSTTYGGPSIFNPGASPVTINSISISGPQASDFSTSGYCPLSPNSLGPGQYCNLNISFVPLATGLRMANLVLKVASGAPQTVLLTGEGVAATKLVTFSSPGIVFSSVPVGTPPQNAPGAYVFVQNSGTAPVNIQSIQFGGANPGDFQLTYDSCTGLSLAAGINCYLNFSFNPSATGFRSADLVVIDDAQGGVQSLPLTGAGTPPVTQLQFFPEAIAFTPTGSANPESVQVNIQNSGSEPVTVQKLAITGQNAPDFTITQDYCPPQPFSLAAQTVCTLFVQFDPSAVGARIANLQIANSAPGSPQMIPLEGTGQKATVKLKFETAPVDLGPTMVGFTYYGATSLENLGSVTAQLSTEIKGANATEFNATNDCVQLSPNSACYLQVSFSPSAAGLRVATLVVTDAVSGQSAPVGLIGSGLPAGSVLNASSPYFSPTAVGTTVEQSGGAYVSNQGSSPITISSFALAGPAKSDFGLVQNGCTPGVILYPYNSCYLQVSFTPSAVGTRVAGINVGGDSGSITIPMGGLGLAPARTIAFGTAALDFDPVPLGASSTASTYIQNAGTEAVSLTRVSLAGANAGDFAITENECPQSPATLAPNSSCTVSVQLSPSALGTRLARLQVVDNASGSPQSLSLAGFGVSAAPAIEYNPNGLYFNTLPLGSSQQQSLSLQAVPGAPVSLTGLHIVGPDDGDFVMTNDCTSPLVQCDVYVTFTPSVSGLRSADLQLQDNAVGNPQLIPLSGFGTVPPPPSATLSLFPIPVAFPVAQGVGYTATYSMGISNSGTENVLLTGFHIGGRSAKDFGIQTNQCPRSPAPLTPSQVCYITIAFKPSAPGVRLATFSVTDNASGSPQSVSIVGKGVIPVTTVEVTPTSVTFPSIPVGSVDFDGGSVNIYNNGTTPVTFTGFTLSGPNASDFSVDSNFCQYSLVMAPGYACQILLNFAPSATGTRTAQLTISSDAKGSPQQIPLTGTGQ